MNTYTDSINAKKRAEFYGAWAVYWAKDTTSPEYEATNDAIMAVRFAKIYIKLRDEGFEKKEYCT